MEAQEKLGLLIAAVAAGLLYVFFKVENIPGTSTSTTGTSTSATVAVAAGNISQPSSVVPVNVSSVTVTATTPPASSGVIQGTAQSINPALIPSGATNPPLFESIKSDMSDDDLFNLIQTNNPGSWWDPSSSSYRPEAAGSVVSGIQWLAIYNFLNPQAAGCAATAPDLSGIAQLSAASAITAAVQKGATVAGSVVSSLSDVASALGPITLGIGTAIGIFAKIFEQRAIYQANERNALCILAPSANDTIQAIITAVENGTITSDEAVTELIETVTAFIFQLQSNAVLKWDGNQISNGGLAALSLEGAAASLIRYFLNPGSMTLAAYQAQQAAKGLLAQQNAQIQANLAAQAQQEAISAWAASPLSN